MKSKVISKLAAVAKAVYKKYRSSKTGRFVTAAFARRHPSTTQGIDKK